MLKIAIYVRKSKFVDTSESTENQIKMCKEHILFRFRNEEVEFAIYEDEGYSGETTNRPKFKEMIRDIKKFNYLVCYRLDRISRNVADFAETLSILESNNCKFISVTENFDTSSPMGRAMIYIASVFAQLERETTAERIRDNMLVLAKDGKWTGGNYPLGFTSITSEYIDESGNTKKCSKLIIDPVDIETVKLIYDTYLKVGSLSGTETFLLQNNIKNKKGTFYDASSLRIILENPVYCKVNDAVIDFLKEDGLQSFGTPDRIHSYLSYNKTRSVTINGKKTKAINPKEEWIVALSPIEGIFDAEYWLKVQRQLKDNRDYFPRIPRKHNALFSGKVYCKRCGSNMIVRNGKKTISGTQNYDYTCSLKRKSKSSLCQSKNINIDILDNIVISQIKNLWPTKNEILLSLKQKEIKEKAIDPKIEINKLNNLINEKKRKIDNLIDAAFTDDELRVEFLRKAKIIKKEVSDLEIKMNSLNSNIKQSHEQKLNISIIEEMLEKCSNIDSMSKEEKEKLAHFFIDSIYADKSTGEIIVNFTGFNKKK